MNKETFFVVIAATAIVFSESKLKAAAVTPGDLVIYRVGDGLAALGTTATAVFLDEYTTSGTLVQSIALPTTGGSALSAVGTATSEGIISRSQDGNSLVFTGYRKATGGANPSLDSYTTTARVIGTLTANGTVNTTTSITSDGGATTANTIRSATTVDGTAFWVSTSARVSYDASPFASGGTTQIDARNSRQVNLSGNTLYAGNGAAITGKIQTYGTLPTSATTASPIVSLATSDAINSFALFDLSSSIAGDDTLYTINTIGNTLLKYTFNGSTWTASGSLSLASTAGTGAANITGFYNGTSLSLYMTSASGLSTITDSSGYGGTLSGSFSSLATAGANTAFRGIGLFAPVPEPSSVAIALAGGFGIWMITRRRK